MYKRLRNFTWLIITLLFLAFSASAQVTVESSDESLETQIDGSPDIRFWGDAKIRLKNTGYSDVSYPLGPFGEALKKGRKLNHRMTLEFEAKVSEKLSAGGMIRLSNEDKTAFEAGPERLSSDRGSAFIRYNPGFLSSTFGYYDVYFTPLTLMRWDMADNPQGGGKTTCACTTAGGEIKSESLEELGPELTFEGGEITAGIGKYIDTTALLARPQTASEGKTYEQYLYGANVRFLSYHKPSTSFRWLGIKALSVKDIKTSVSDPSRILYAPFRSKIYSVDFNLPVMEYLALKGEVALSDSSSEKAQGYATILGVSVKFPDRVLTDAAYLWIDPEYSSLYRALSYESNRHGFRISSRCEFIKGKSTIWLFYKRLRELESLIKKEPDLLNTTSILSFGISAKLIDGLMLSTSYILESSHRDKGAYLDELQVSMHSINTELSYDLSRESSLAFKYQYIKHRDKFDQKADYHADVTSVLVSTKF